MQNKFINKILVNIKGEYQEQVKNVLAQFKKYEKGQISKKEVDIDKNNAIYQFVANLRKARLMIKCYLEIDRSKESQEDIEIAKKHLEQQVLPLLQKSAQAFEKIKATGDEDKINKSTKTYHSFDQLFAHLEQKPRIKRSIYQVDCSSKNVGSYHLEFYPDLFFQSRRKFVLFGIEPDGNCLLYCIDLRSRAEALDLIIDNLDYPQLKYAVLERIVYKHRQTFTKDLGIVLNATANKDEVIREISQREDCKNNQSFANWVRQYMQTGWFNNRILSYLCEAIQRKNLKQRGVTQFVVSGNSADRKLNLSTRSEVGVFYPFVWNQPAKGVISIYEDAQTFRFTFTHPSGEELVDSFIGVQEIQRAFEIKSRWGFTYEKFIQAVKEGSLQPDQAVEARIFIFQLIAEEMPSYAPTFYQYNYVSTELHASRLVELEDYKQLIKGKIHEQRFNLFQDQSDYDSYERTWVKPS